MLSVVAGKIVKFKIYCSLLRFFWRPFFQTEAHDASSSSYFKEYKFYDYLSLIGV